jgi:hypothetical protein
MPQETSPRNLLPACLAVSLLAGVLSFLPGTLVPLVGILAPAPLMIAFLALSPSRALAIALLTAAAVAVFSSPRDALSYLAVAAVPALAFAWAVSRGRSLASASIAATGLLLGGLMVVPLLLSPGDPWAALRFIQGDLANVLDILRPVMERWHLSRELVIAIFPALFAASSLLNVLFFATLSLGVLRRIRPAEYPSFLRWAMPDYLIWLLILAGFALLRGTLSLHGIPLAVMIFLVVLYTLQGLAIGLHRARLRGVPAALMVVFLLLVLLQPFLLAIPLLFGLLDFRFDFRRPPPPTP